MLDLTKTTFIIPLRIESSDRFRNILLALHYLLKNMKTNIMIAESDSDPKVPFVLEQLKSIDSTIDTSLVKHLFYKTNESLFHRMYLLNEMLFQVTTPVVVNYDCDIVLPLSSYEKAQEMCLQEYDLVYPFGFGDNKQYRVTPTEEDINNFIETSDVNALKNWFLWRAEYGFCQFFKTNSYKNSFFGECQLMQSYGPEDVLRHHTCKTLGGTIGRIDNIVLHFEHNRNINNTSDNPFFRQNEEICKKLMNMRKEELIQFFESQEYVKNRK